MAARETTAIPLERARTGLPRVRLDRPRRAGLCDGWKAEGTHSGFSGLEAWTGRGARLVGRGGCRAGWATS